MADTTWAVKVTDELKEEIINLNKKSGLQGKDFMQYLLSLYEIEEAKETIPEIAEDLRELQVLTQRINDVYLNLSYRIENINIGKEEEVKKEIMQREKSIKELKIDLDKIKEENEDLHKEFNNKVKSEKELQDKVKQVNESYKNLMNLSNEYKEKIDTLLIKVKDMEGFEAENSELKIASNKLTEEVKKLNNTIDQKDEYISSLEQSKNELKIKHEEKLVLLQKQLENENEKSILNLQKQYQNDIADLKLQRDEKIEKYQHKIEDLQQMHNNLLKDFNNRNKEDQLVLKKLKEALSNKDK
jgi:chromosome segregation ATPase